MGYPGAADSNLLDAKSQLEPTTNDGKISAKKTSADGAPILQTSAPTTHGNSGGPAINEKGEVIGLLTFRGNEVNGQEVQGFNFIVPINTAQEFVRQAGTENSRSSVDAEWREGLDHFWAQEYRSAQQNFGKVASLFPDHTEAAKLFQESQEHIAKGEDQSNAGAYGVVILIVIGGGLLLLVIGVLLVVVIVVKRKKSSKGRVPLASPHVSQPQAYTSQPQPQQNYNATANSWPQQSDQSGWRGHFARLSADGAFERSAGDRSISAKVGLHGRTVNGTGIPYRTGSLYWTRWDEITNCCR